MLKFPGRDAPKFAGIFKMFVFWALKMLTFPWCLLFGVPKHAGFFRMSAFEQFIT